MVRQPFGVHVHTAGYVIVSVTVESASMSKKDRLIKRIDNDLLKIEREALKISKRISAKFVRKALQEYRKHGRIPPGLLQQHFTEPLSRAMYAVTLVGQRRAQIMFARRKSLQLDQMGDLIRTLEQQLDISFLNSAQEQWETTALQVLDATSIEIETKLRTTVNGLIAGGATTRQATSVLQSTFDSLGLTPTNSFQLETIFRTQSQIAYQAGRWKVDQDPDIQEILWGYEYFTVEDNRVRPEHAALHGTILPKDNQFWLTFWPPNGWNCRCQVLPVFRRVPVKNPPADAAPDDGFSFNPGVIYG